MNPSSFEQKKLEAFAHHGINRLSIGIQSLQDPILQFLGRKHSAAEACAALTFAKTIFSNISADLMYGHHHHRKNPANLSSLWQKEVLEILSFELPHISLYHLTYEPGTPFFHQLKQGQMPTLTEDESIELMVWTKDTLEQHGLFPYEISNYAKPGYPCRHNLNYWRYGNYLGIGPGAHGRLLFNSCTTNKTIHPKATSDTHDTSLPIASHPQRYGFINHSTPQKWLDQSLKTGSGLKESHLISPKEILKEQLMMGLRLTQGLLLESIQKETHSHFFDWIPFSALAPLIQEGWLVLEKVPQIVSQRKKDIPISLSLQTNIPLGKTTHPGILPENKQQHSMEENLVSKENYHSIRITKEGLFRLDGILAYLFDHITPVHNVDPSL
jgi:coproporphyrinogen III oxidase-like Fe-S oxidoreductase